MSTSASPPRGQPILSDAARREIEDVVQGGLGDLSLRTLLATTLDALSVSERATYLSTHPADKGNGGYDRGLRVGSMPLEISVPRSRSGDFRPSILPERYQRGFSDEDRALIMGLLTASRSIAAAKSAMRKMGLPIAETELDTVAAEFVEAIKLKNSAPVPVDLLALYIDGKYVEIRDGDKICPACIYVVVGLGTDGCKRILACTIELGQESLEGLKKVLKGLIERGLRRVLIVVQDDFSGLLKLTQGLFPKADIQLCIVHMQRNATTHLPKDRAGEFMARLKTIKTMWSKETAATQFDELCNDFAEAAPAFIDALRSKREHYLHFLSYPVAIRRSFSTTNAVETVNGQLERMRRNNGGYFHSQDTLRLKLGITIDYLETGRWKTPAACVRAVLPQLLAMFAQRFDNDDS
jgi:transposase-like protein